MPLGPLSKASNATRKRSKSQSKQTIAKKAQAASERKSEPKKGHPQHAQLEAKCDLVNIIELLFPHLEGEAVIGGEPFPCPLPTHLDGDTRKMRLTQGRLVAKPYWKCGAGCCKDKHNDTIDFIRSALGIPFPKAVSLWAKLAAAPPKDRRSIIETAYPTFYAEGKAA